MYKKPLSKVHRVLYQVQNAFSFFYGTPATGALSAGKENYLFHSMRSFEK